MVNTTCREVAGVDCRIRLKGNSPLELQQNVFSHTQKDHGGTYAAMTLRDQARMIQRVDDIYNQKAWLTLPN